MSSRSAARRRLIAAGRLPALVSAVIALHLAAAWALAADPSPTPGAGAGDPRSAGEGPGLVGDPLLAIGIVVAIGAAALLVTLAYVRLTARGAERR